MSLSRAFKRVFLKLFEPNGFSLSETILSQSAGAELKMKEMTRAVSGTVPRTERVSE
jgi:hypothetical protein